MTATVRYLRMAAAMLVTMLPALPARAEPALPAGCSPVAGNAAAPGQAGYRIRRARDGAELVWVPAGKYKSGSLFGGYVEIRFQADRQVAGFWLDRCEVTNGRYSAFLRATRRAVPSLWPGGRVPRGREEHPVPGVSWADACAYAAWVGGRLPTEVEWEYAARGAEGKAYPWGEGFDAARAVWCGSRPATRTAAVGSIAANASWCGALDLAGNVYEWVNGYFHGYEGAGGMEAKEGREYHILRGGSYYTMAECLKGSYRHLVRPGTVRADFGFRVAMGAGGKAAPLSPRTRREPSPQATGSARARAGRLAASNAAGTAPRGPGSPRVRGAGGASAPMPLIASRKSEIRNPKSAPIGHCPGTTFSSAAARQ